MSELDHVMIGVATAVASTYLLSPSAVWRVAKTVSEWAVVILVLIWAL